MIGRETSCSPYGESYSRRYPTGWNLWAFVLFGGGEVFGVGAGGFGFGDYGEVDG